jgi:NAD(P) transhydrogenase subunit alpha
VPVLRAAGVDVVVEPGAGAAAWFTDEAYAAAGASLTSRSDLCVQADVIVSVGRPADDVLSDLHSGQTVVGMLRTFTDPAYARRLAGPGLTAVSLDGCHTLSRAQDMDALTSQANVAGYASSRGGGERVRRLLPDAGHRGRHRPARAGAGARRAASPACGRSARPVGWAPWWPRTTYGRSPVPRSSRSAAGSWTSAVRRTLPERGGYAGRSPWTSHAQRDALAGHLGQYDAVITTAQVPGGRRLLVDEEGVKGMAPGSVIVDLAAGPSGGNVAPARAGETVVTEGGVTVVGADNLPATVPTAASAAYSRNLTALLRHLVREGELSLDLSDEIQAGVVITHAGRVVHPAVTRLLEGAS